MEMETNKQSAFFYGWVIVAVAIITSMLVYGVRYSFSIFFPEILSEFGWSRGSTALMMSINVFVYGLMAPIAGALSSARNPKMLMPIGVAILALAMIGCSVARELWHFYLFYGVMVPMGTALCGWPVLSPALMNWFSTRRGLIMGFGQAGSGLSFAYGLLTQYLILHLGWRLAYVALAAILVAILLPLHRFVFRYHPAGMGLKAYGTRDFKSGTGVGSGVPSRDWTVPQMLRTYQLWLLIFYFFLFWGIAGFLVLAHQIKYAEDAGYSSVFAVSVFALFGFSMFLGQVSGVISDRIGREKTMVLSSASALIGLSALIAVRDTSQPWLLYVYAIVFGFGAGLSTVILFAGVADIFSGRHFGTASGMMLTGMGTGGAIGPWLGGYLYDVMGSYDLAFLLCMASIGLASACYWFAAPRNAVRLRAKRLDSHVGERLP